MNIRFLRLHFRLLLFKSKGRNFSKFFGKRFGVKFEISLTRARKHKKVALECTNIEDLLLMVNL